VAVLACGVDVPYPTAHTELFNSIAAQGVIVSEWPPGRTVSRLRFLVRNRVIAALATGTLVVEAGTRSGALNTARHARDLGRRLMAVPGPVTSDISAGCHQIIRDWQGMLVTSAADVIEHLSPVGAAQAPVLAAATEAPARAQAGRRPASRRPARPALDRDQLDLESAQLLDAMPGRGGMATTRIAQRAGVTPNTAIRVLGGLASAGFIERCEEGWRLPRG
jgi:DNA processing protein